MIPNPVAMGLEFVGSEKLYDRQKARKHSKKKSVKQKAKC
jgi:hypothetical protein